MAALATAWTSATTSGMPLITQLSLYQASSFAKVSGGSLSSVSANQRMSAFSRFGAGTLTQVQMVQIWGLLIREYYIAKKGVQCQLGWNVTPSDLLIYHAMNERLALPVTESYVDMTNLLVDVERDFMRLPTLHEQDTVFLTLAMLRLDTNLFDRKFAVMSGLNDPGDGQGHLYRFAADSVLPENVPLVIIPTCIAASGATGRYIAIT